MKAKVTITELTHEDLVCLIATATYGSPWLGFQYNKLKCRNIQDTDTAEDIAAKILMYGGTIDFIDEGAEDAADIYSPSGYFESNAGIYPVTSDMIRQGLENALNGTFKATDRQEKSYARRCAAELLKDEPDLDIDDAETLMQIILFNEIIYC